MKMEDVVLSRVEMADELVASKDGRCGSCSRRGGVSVLWW